MTDIATGCTENRAVRNKVQAHVFAALTDVVEHLPFPVRGIDSDNGSEFINHELFRYCDQHGQKFTRSRSGNKNDGAHVEQKNWTTMRQLVGYLRYDTAAELLLLNKIWVLQSLVTDILGVSGRAMLTALIDGERDPETLAELARQRLRNKHDALVETVIGHFDDHHAFLCRIILGRIDELTQAAEEVTKRIDTELAPFQEAVEHLVSIPGVDRKAAAVIIAETGDDMTRFATAGHLVACRL